MFDPNYLMNKNSLFTAVLDDIPLLLGLTDVFIKVYYSYKHSKDNNHPMNDVRLDVYSNETGYKVSLGVRDIVVLTEEYLGFIGKVGTKKLIDRKLRSDKFGDFLEKKIQERVIEI